MTPPRLFLLVVLVSRSLAGFALAQPPPEGLTGHLAVTVNNGQPVNGFTHGFSFYTSVHPVTSTPFAGVQLGWGTWFYPDNRAFTKALCPTGTLAGDNWGDDWGPTFHGVFQTVEGGVGQWVSTRFPSSVPKYRINAVPDCYNTQLASPGWTFGAGAPLPANKLGLAQLSNRLLLAPDGMTFTAPSKGALLGNGWIALPLIPPSTSPAGAPTGNRSLTLFLRASNFKGPVAFFVPEVWSALSAGYPTIVGRGHDALGGYMRDLALEIGETPAFTGQDRHGVRYRRVPRLTFDADATGTAVLMQDVKYYAPSAIWNGVASWIANGTVATGFNAAGIASPGVSGQSAPLRLGGAPIAFNGGFFAGKITTNAGGEAFGMRWTAPFEPGAFPEYFKEENGTWKPVPAGDVPAETGLAAKTFPPQPRSAVPPLDASTPPWLSTGWSAGPFTAALNDGSSVEYVWYRFVDQPAIVRLGLSAAVRQQLQTFVESLHEHSGLDGISIAPPTSGLLATLDSAQFVMPPPGLERGYVPIVIRQYKPVSISAEEMAALEALYVSTNGDSWTNSSNWFSGPVDTWHGITVANDHVVAISLPGNNLTGVIPAAIGNLTALRSLELSGNHLSGPIPAAIGNLSELDLFSAFNNDLDGGIPAAFGNLKKLRTLELGNNELTGRIPGALGGMATLRYLSLVNNRLSGLVPSALGDLAALGTLRLQLNALTGPLPPRLSNLKALHTFEFNGTTICIPSDAELQAWLGSIASVVSTNQPCLAGTLRLAARITASGVHAPGVRYVDVELSATGTGYALRPTISSVALRTLAGTGTVTLANLLPTELDTIGPGAAATVRLLLNVPSTVTRFSITEGGTLRDVTGKLLTFSFGQSIVP